MGVCLVVCSCGQYTGLCVFGALRKVASILAFAGLRVKGGYFYPYTEFYVLANLFLLMLTHDFKCHNH